MEYWETIAEQSQKAGWSWDCVSAIDSTGFYSAIEELYDPETWTVTGSLNAGRGLQTATLLPDGKVLLVAGGAFSSHNVPLASAERYGWPRPYHRKETVR